MCNFNVHFSKIFWGLRRPSSDPTPLGAPALRASTPRSRPSVPPSSCPPLQKSWLRAWKHSRHSHIHHKFYTGQFFLYTNNTAKILSKCRIVEEVAVSWTTLGNSLKRSSERTRSCNSCHYSSRWHIDILLFVAKTHRRIHQTAYFKIQKIFRGHKPGPGCRTIMHQFNQLKILIMATESTVVTWPGSLWTLIKKTCGIQRMGARVCKGVVLCTCPRLEKV